MAPISRSLQAAIAVTRFGLGARPGEIAKAAADPHGWLTAQIRAEGGDLPTGAWPDAQSRLVALQDYRQQVRALKAEYGVQGKGAPAAAPAGGPRAASAPVLDSASQPVAQTGLLQPAVDQGAFKAAQQQARRSLNDETLDEVLARAQLAATTPAGFRERWTLFWSNHFSTGGKNEEMQTLSPVFEREAIRPHVFGRFTVLLEASSTHPGMIHYLDQVRSIGPNSVAGSRNAKVGLNENLAREIMELHTVGADAGYTQADVTEFARALTGVTIGNGQPRGGAFGQVVFRDDWHEPGVRTVMGRRYADEGGPKAASAIIDALAADPRTARRISRKIAAHFVADDPPPALSARLEQAWLRSGGDLAQVAQALVAAPEAWDPAPRKLKTPYEFLVSSWRAAASEPANPRIDVVQPLTGLGQRPFYAPQPNGWSDDAASWSAPDAVMKRLYWAQAFATAHTPAEDPRQLAIQVLGDRLTAPSALAVSRAESRSEAFAILVMTPEFQRR